MCHKDLNVYKYGDVSLMAMWEEDGPVLLANKANAATIRLSNNSDSAAVQKAVEASSRGGTKLANLCGMLFRNKNEITGYQSHHRLFMEAWKRETYAEEIKEKIINPTDGFPDTNNTRYQSHSRATAELIKFTPLYIELIQTVVDAKTDSGSENHMETTVLKGLHCQKTLTEMAPQSLYGLTVSWPYLRYARGGGTKTLINLLDTTDIHRHIAPFCRKITANPTVLLDPSSPLSDITIDGQECMDPMLITAVRKLAPDLPDLNRAISAMFGGGAMGWDIFTSEFVEGGPFDQLTPEERVGLFIPSTNDANEGALGSLCSYKKHCPNGSADSFSDKVSVERNDTEDFIATKTSPVDLQYVMRIVRQRDKDGANKRFRLQLANNLCRKAAAQKAKKQQALHKQTECQMFLQNAELVLEEAKIQQLTVKALKIQVQIHWHIHKDPVLTAAKKSELTTKLKLVEAVAGAALRYKAR